MICDSYEEMMSFSKYLDSTGRTWKSGDRYTEKYLKTGGLHGGCAFCFNNNSYFSDIKQIDNKYTIIYWHDFEVPDYIYPICEISFEIIIEEK